jgi:hypothetical protein
MFIKGNILWIYFSKDSKEKSSPTFLHRMNGHWLEAVFSNHFRLVAREEAGHVGGATLQDPIHIGAPYVDL